MAPNETVSPKSLLLNPVGVLIRLIPKFLLALLLCFAFGFGLQFSRSFSIADTPPVFGSVGPTVTQLEKLQFLVSTRVHVADVLVGESRWLRGSWIVQGDALIGVDMSKAEIQDKDEKKRTAVVVLPAPIVTSPRVNHERTQAWDVQSRSWIPLAGSVLGDQKTLEQQAMMQAQLLVERAASVPEHLETARRDVEGSIKEFYGQVDWRVEVKWK